MKILLLGGTGAMGAPLAKLLSDEGHNVYVTSRRQRHDGCNISYIAGNAMQEDFIRQQLTSSRWDAIVDFMNRGEENLRNLLPTLLDATGHYVFLSSARVFAASDGPITERSPRLLDVCNDADYLRTDEYALAKSREEDLLRASGRANYTIVRPTITYNSHRLQLGAYEKEGWLYRALHGRSIVFSNDMRHLLTAMTHGDDVARSIAALLNLQATGEDYNITSPSSITWDEVLRCYLEVLTNHFGHQPKVLYTPLTTCWGLKEQHYRLKYCRLHSRTFDCAKLSKTIDPMQFTPPQKGLSQCMEEFMNSPSFIGIHWQLEALNDRAAHEHTPLSEIPTTKGKTIYLIHRHNLKAASTIYNAAVKMAHIIKR